MNTQKKTGKKMQFGWFSRKRMSRQDALYEKLYSVIIPIYNTEQYLAKAIDSVINQSVGFEKNVQLILLDDGSSDNSALICYKYLRRYPNNVVFRKIENSGPSVARNCALEFVVGKYVCFLDSDDYLDKNYLAECGKFLDANYKKIDMCFTNHFLFERVNKRHPAVDGFHKSMIVSLNDQDGPLATRVNFFKSSILQRYKFNENFVMWEDNELINRIIKEKKAFGYVHTTTYFYRMRAGQDSIVGNQDETSICSVLPGYLRGLFDEDLNRFKRVRAYTQRNFLFLLSWVCKQWPKEFIGSELYNNMRDTIEYCLNYVSDDAIAKWRANSNYWLKMYLLELRHGIGVLEERGEKPCVMYGNVSFNLNSTVHIAKFRESDGVVHINGLFYTRSSEFADLVVKYNNREYVAVASVCEFSTKKIFFLGEEYMCPMQFDIYIPFESDGIIEIYWRTKNGRRVSMEINNMLQSPFNNNMKNGEIVLGQNTVVKKLDKTVFSIKRLIVDELKYMLNQAANGYLKPYENIVTEYINRCDEFQGRRIWVFCDRLNGIEDNGWWLYQYAKKQKDGIEKYFMYSSKAKDWDKIAHDPNVLDYEKIEHRVYLFFCEKFLSSQWFWCVFYDSTSQDVKNDERLVFQTLFKSQQIYLQHGVNKENIGNVFSAYFNDPTLVITACKREYEYFLGGEFGYSSDLVKMTGLPRFDHLFNEPEKIIVYAPTWDKGNSFRCEYNNAFKQTAKYKLIQNLINDDKLCEFLQKNGYSFYVKLHPYLLMQLKDFSTKYENVIKFVESDVTYPQLFKKGCLFITDYSSTFFDFGYLKKPVLYYQEKANHYACDENYFTYERDGFGEICKDKESLVDEIIKCIDNDCKMSEKYQNRVDNWFTFIDRNNCKRVYNEISKIPARKGDKK